MHYGVSMIQKEKKSVKRLNLPKKKKKMEELSCKIKYLPYFKFQVAAQFWDQSLSTIMATHHVAYMIFATIRMEGNKKTVTKNLKPILLKFAVEDH